MSIERKLEQVLSRHQEIEALLSAGGMSSEDFARLSKEYSDLGPIAALVARFKAAKAEQAGVEQMLADAALDREMKDLAEADFYRLKTEVPAIEHEIRLALIPKDAADSKSAILEIRAGTGGDEAALFAADLFGMYKGYAGEKGWGFEVMDLSESDLGGLKQVVVEVSGSGVFGRLKYESGVHRVQRVPKTEASGRVHTSAATVAVLPEAEDVDIEIDEKDLKIETYRAGGAGGQHVNKTESAIRITHVPTGVVVAQQDERSQHKNRARAMKILRAKLYEAQRLKQDALRAADRKDQVGSGDRSERIRTYNFPQGRVTDHRVNVTLYKLDRVMNGESLDEIIDPLAAEEQAARLAETGW